ncbi:glycosyltransferase family 1 protein, partial [Candidatus Woesearchaeota archaeon CG_4_10_14_0_8_um_filter_47_5]
MKIGIITDAIDDNAAGMGTYVRNLCDNLKKNYTSHDLVYIHYKKNKDTFYHGAHEIIIPFRSLPLKREIRKVYDFPHILRHRHFDIIHEPVQIGPFFLQGPYKKVLTIHDLTPLLFPLTHKFSTHLHHRYGLPRVLRRVDRVICVSESTKKDLLSFFPVDLKKIKVIYNGVDPSFAPIKDKYRIQKFHHDFQIDFPYLLFVGTLEPRKNLVTVLDAFSMIRKKHSDLRLFIVGRKGWKYHAIYDKIYNLGIAKHTILTGMIPEEDLIMFFNRAEAFIYPSLYEGFGLPVAEAMRCGCPVITSSISSLPEVAGDAALLVNPYDPREAAAALDRVLSDSKLRSEMREKG